MAASSGTQGSGKSLTMVWLAKWIRENVTDSRVLIITDRTELDEQIEKVFSGVEEEILRTKSGADLVTRLHAHNPWLICSLVQVRSHARRRVRMTKMMAARMILLLICAAVCPRTSAPRGSCLCLSMSATELSPASCMGL